MWNRIKPFAYCAATLALAAGCSTTGSATLPSPAPAPAAQAQPKSGNPNKGIVAEVIQAGRYSLISVDSGSAKTWFAVPSAEVKVGQQVDVQQGMEVKNYTVKSLNRTFDTIYFTDGLTITEVAKPASKGLPAYHPPLGKTPGSSVAGGKSIAGKVTEVIKGSDYTYVRVDGTGTDTWVAVPANENVAEGETAKFLPGQEIKNFASSKLNRTFDRIIFSGGVDRK